MSLTNKQLRDTTRILHIVGAILIGTFVYSPLRINDAFVLLMQVGMIPLLTLTGLVMWQQARVFRLLRRNRNSGASATRPAYDCSPPDARL